jgi:hypothetical protein
MTEHNEPIKPRLQQTRSETTQIAAQGLDLRKINKKSYFEERPMERTANTVTALPTDNSLQHNNK